MTNAKMKTDVEYIIDEDGEALNYEYFVSMLDDEVREHLHLKLSPCTNQEFYDGYVSFKKV